MENNKSQQEQEVEKDVAQLQKAFEDFSNKYEGNKGISAFTLFNLCGDWRLSITMHGSYIRQLESS
jgi:hypothetical protein